MKLDAKQVRDILGMLKLVFTKDGSQQYPEWVAFSDGVFYARNGFFFAEVSQEGLPKQSSCIILNGAQLITLLGAKPAGDITINQNEGIVLIKYGKKTLEFNPPLAKDEFFKDYYFPKKADYFDVMGFKKGLDLAMETVYDKNIEFSNAYCVNNVLVSSDGNRITTYYAEGMPDTSIPVKTDKVLFFEPSKVFVTDEIVTFIYKDDVSFYCLSATKNIGNASAITRIIPKDDPLYVCKPSDDFKKILETGSKMDQEFKKQDVMIEVKIEENVIECQLNGHKTKYKEAAACQHEVPFIFRVNPSHFLSGFAVSSEFLYDPNLRFIQFNGPNCNRMISIEVE